jgi:hypothetical protein
MDGVSTLSALARPIGRTVPPFEIFLSHSSADEPRVRLVAEQMTALGVKVYVAVHDPQPGTSVTQKIKAAIRRADATVVLLTTAGADSAYVQQEIGVAEGCDKLVVPLVDVRVDLIKLGMLTDREWIKVDFSDQGATLNTLAASIQPTIDRRQREKKTAIERADRADALVALAIIGLIALFLASSGGKAAG